MAGETTKRDLELTYSNMDKLMGDDWETNMIQFSRNVMGKAGAAMLRQMGIREDRTEPVDLFDNACGSGLLASEAQQILSRDVLEKSTMFCADNSQLFVDLVKRRVEREGWVRTGAKVLDATVRRFCLTPQVECSHLLLDRKRTFLTARSRMWGSALPYTSSLMGMQSFLVGVIHICTASEAWR
jgi:hypothetical protein